MTEYTRTFYKLTVGPGVGTGEAYEGEAETGPEYFRPGNIFFTQAMREVGAKANAAFIIERTVFHPDVDNFDPLPEVIDRAEVGRLAYGPFKSSLPHDFEIKILRIERTGI